MLTKTIDSCHYPSGHIVYKSKPGIPLRSRPVHHTFLHGPHRCHLSRRRERCPDPGWARVDFLSPADCPNFGRRGAWPLWNLGTAEAGGFPQRPPRRQTPYGVPVGTLELELARRRPRARSPAEGSRPPRPAETGSAQESKRNPLGLGEDQFRHGVAVEDHHRHPQGQVRPAMGHGAPVLGLELRTAMVCFEPPPDPGEADIVAGKHAADGTLGMGISHDPRHTIPVLGGVLYPLAFVGRDLHSDPRPTGIGRIQEITGAQDPEKRPVLSTRF